MERRRYPRYKLSTPIVGYIEHRFRRYRGQVVDLSASGVQLWIPRINEDEFSFPGITDWTEIVVDEKLVGGFGRGIYARRARGGVLVGFEWDEYVYNTHWQTFGAVIEILQHNEQTPTAERSRPVVYGKKAGTGQAATSTTTAVGY